MTNIQDNNLQRSLKEFQAEVFCHVAINGHPNVVDLVGICTDWPNFAIFTEYILLGDLQVEILVII